jgi:hypothetical protein
MTVEIKEATAEKDVEIAKKVQDGLAELIGAGVPYLMLFGVPEKEINPNEGMLRVVSNMDPEERGTVIAAFLRGDVAAYRSYITFTLAEIAGDPEGRKLIEEYLGRVESLGRKERAN